MMNNALTIIEALHKSTAHTCNILLTAKRDTEEVSELSNECDQGQKKVSVQRETEVFEVRMKMLKKNQKMIKKLDPINY